MQVLELADEFNLTSVEAAEISVAAGVVDATALTELDDAQVARWRELATARRQWIDQGSRTPVGVGPASSFGPIPAAPWERGTSGAGSAGPPPLGPEVDRHLTPYAPAALVLAVVSLVFPFIPAVAAILLGWYAKDRVERSDGRLSGARLATAAQVVAGIAVALWALLLVVTIYQDARTATPDDGQVEIGLVGWDQIGPGQCIRVPRADLSVNEWTGLDCGAPHEAEVYSTEQVAPTSNPNEPYPGRASLIPATTRLCQERFAEYVGVPYESSNLRIALYFPSGANWTTQDDRTLGCIVFREDHALIDGTLAGSGL